MMSKEGIGKQEYSQSPDDRYPEPKRIRVGSDDGFAMSKEPDRAVKKRRP